MTPAATLATTIAALIPGLLALCAILALTQRRLAGLVTNYRLQAFTLAAAALWQSQARMVDLAFAALILAGNAMVLPATLRRLATRFDDLAAPNPAIPAGPLTVLAFALAGLAVLATPPIPPVIALPRMDVAICLALLLIGALRMATSRNPLAQLMFFLNAEAGVILAAILTPGLPFVAAFVLALMLLNAALLALLTRHFAPQGANPA